MSWMSFLVHNNKTAVCYSSFQFYLLVFLLLFSLISAVSFLSGRECVSHHFCYCLIHSFVSFPLLLFTFYSVDESLDTVELCGTQTNMPAVAMAVIYSKCRLGWEKVIMWGVNSATLTIESLSTCCSPWSSARSLSCLAALAVLANLLAAACSWPVSESSITQSLLLLVYYPNFSYSCQLSTLS